MSSISVRMALLISVLVLIPSTLQAQPVAKATALQQGSASEPVNSTLNIPIEEIAATLGGCTILDKIFPGLRKHSMYEHFKSMTLNQIAAMSHGQISPDMLAKAQTDLSALHLTRVSGKFHKPDNKDLDLAPADNQTPLSESTHK